MEPDPEWCLDNVIAASGPERAPVGPVRQHQAAWWARVNDLRTDDPLTGPVIELAIRQGLVITRRDLRDIGVPDADTRRHVRRGEWTIPRHGVVCPLRATTTGPSGAEHEIHAAAAALVWRDSSPSHASAAAMHGLPLLTPPGPPTLTVGRGLRAYSFDNVRVHVAAMADDDFGDWFGVPVTAIARTVADLARSRGVKDGLVAADAALHERLITPAELSRAVDRQWRWPGVRAARRVVALADGRAESPLESLARLCFANGCLPAPEPQVWIDTAGGRFRVDFLWPQAKLIVETDGLIKYRDWRALADEKRRHLYLERAGYTVIRLIWTDVTRDARMTVARLAAALTR